MVERLYHRGDDGHDYMVGIAIPEQSPPSANADGDTCACYLIRFRIWSMAGRERIAFLRCPFFPSLGQFLYPNTIEKEMSRAIEMLKAQEPFDPTTSIDILDIVLVAVVQRTM